MKYVNVIDAKEQFAELVKLIDTAQEDKIVLTYNDKPIVEMIRPQAKIPRDKLFGYGKGKHKLPDDFDEQFVAMDAEIWREVADSYEVNK